MCCGAISFLRFSSCPGSRARYHACNRLLLLLLHDTLCQVMCRLFVPGHKGLGQCPISPLAGRTFQRLHKGLDDQRRPIGETVNRQSIFFTNKSTSRTSGEGSQSIFESMKCAQEISLIYLSTTKCRPTKTPFNGVPNGPQTYNTPIVTLKRGVE